MQYTLNVPSVRKLALIGSYVPRQCGIATFSADVVRSISTEYPNCEVIVCAVNDGKEEYSYPAEVKLQIEQHEIESYWTAADALNQMSLDAVSVQHEYGLFGGPAGGHLLSLLKRLKAPIIVTLHTVLQTPDPHQKAVIEELGRIASKLVVMSRRGFDMLREIYGLPADKLEFIPHGVPDLLSDRTSTKQQMGLEGKRVLLTFGLLSPDKGIEHAIKALPAIVEEVPNTVYLVVGATHPHIRAHSGDAYRDHLKAIAREAGVDENVKFIDRFVSIGELIDLLRATDVYITPYLKLDQITSGTLAYAVGSGRAVISTPYWYAKEILDDGRGILVPSMDSAAISNSVLKLLTNDELLASVQEKAFEFGQDMTWSSVARKYMATMHGALAPRLRGSKSTMPLVPNLSHICKISDDRGIFQHACYDVPNYNEGYCVDDNARALLLMSELRQHSPILVDNVDSMLSRYIAFVHHAYNPKTKRFRNFMSHSREWLEDAGSDDSHGRSLWALGIVASNCKGTGAGDLAKELFEVAIVDALEFTGPRTWAFILLGISGYLKAYPSTLYIYEIESKLVERLYSCYLQNCSRDWKWFEEYLTYGNARIPQAMMLASSQLRRKDMMLVALDSLNWLTNQQISSHGLFEPIGSDRVFHRGEVKPIYDQQPLEASGTVSACLTAYELTGDVNWLGKAEHAFEWFFGNNHLNAVVYNPLNGGCFDGLHKERVNLNQGAESTLEFWMAWSDLHRVKRATAQSTVSMRAS